MIEIIFTIIGIIAGSLFTHFLDRRLLKKKWKKEEMVIIDNMLSSLDYEVKNNLEIAKENQENSSHGKSTAQRHNYSLFLFTAYEHFSISLNSKLKGQIGEDALNHLVNGYKQCRKFDQVYKEYKGGKRPASRSDLRNFRKIRHAKVNNQ